MATIPWLCLNSAQKVRHGGGTPATYLPTLGSYIFGWIGISSRSSPVVASKSVSGVPSTYLHGKCGKPAAYGDFGSSQVSKSGHEIY
jgi:hypothetical protein